MFAQPAKRSNPSGFKQGSSRITQRSRILAVTSLVDAVRWYATSAAALPALASSPWTLYPAQTTAGCRSGSGGSAAGSTSFARVSGRSAIAPRFAAAVIVRTTFGRPPCVVAYCSISTRSEASASVVR